MEKWGKVVVISEDVDRLDHQTARNQPISHSLRVLLVARQFASQGSVLPYRSHNQEQARDHRGNQCPQRTQGQRLTRAAMTSGLIRRR